MKAQKKRALKAAGFTSAEVVLDAGGKLFDKTLGRMGRYIALTYWGNRAQELAPEVKACPDCKTDWVQTGYHWSKRSRIGDGQPEDIGVGRDYCAVHAPECKKIIDNYNHYAS